MEGGNRQLEGTLLPPILIPAIAGSFVFLRFRRFWIGAGAFIAAAALVLIVAILRLAPQIAPDAFSPLAISVTLYIVLPILFLVSAGFTLWVIFCFRLAHRSVGLPIATETRNDADCSSLGAAAGASALATCHALVRGDGTACEGLPDDASKECYLSLAIRYRDARYCSSRYRNFEDAACFILVELANQDLVK